MWPLCVSYPRLFLAPSWGSLGLWKQNGRSWSHRVSNSCSSGWGIRVYTFLTNPQVILMLPSCTTVRVLKNPKTSEGSRVPWDCCSRWNCVDSEPLLYTHVLHHDASTHSHRQGNEFTGLLSWLSVVLAEHLRPCNLCGKMLCFGSWCQQPD